MSVYAEAVQKVFGPGALVLTLADTEAMVVDARGMSRLVVIAGSGATITVSRVDTEDASAHTAGAHNAFTVAADSREVTDVDWPFYRVSAAGGGCRIALL